jgi:hypothetical protein
MKTTVVQQHTVTMLCLITVHHFLKTLVSCKEAFMIPLRCCYMSTPPQYLSPPPNSQATQIRPKHLGLQQGSEPCCIYKALRHACQHLGIAPDVWATL